MPTFADITDPARPAVITMELQRGVTGDLAAMKALAAEVQAAGVIDNVRRLCAAARTAGGRVVHCTAAFRADMAGASGNARIIAASVKVNPGPLDQGRPGVEVRPAPDAQ